MTTRPRRARQGFRPTPAAPSAEQLTGVVLDRRAAFEQGHVGALFDELTHARRVATIDGVQRTEEDPVPLPRWAFEALADLGENFMLTGSVKRGRHAHWWRRYREDLIQWHRYALVRQHLDAGWPDNDKRLPDVFQVVSNDLTGALFAGRPSTITASYKAVAAALTRGEHARYYRSTAAHMYDFLLSTAVPEEQRGVGASYGHVYIGYAIVDAATLREAAEKIDRAAAVGTISGTGGRDAPKTGAAKSA